MARIAGVTVPTEKQVQISLTYVYGIGLTTSKKILDAIGIERTARVKDLTETDLRNIREYIADKHIVEGELQRVVSNNIKRLKEIGSYRGERHKRNLPARGQRTRTNARSKRGKKVAVGGAQPKAATKTQDYMAEEQPTTPVEADETAPVAASEEPKKAVKRKKGKRTVSFGQLHIQATFNNTITTFTDAKGNALAASSAGACGFRGSQKGTAYAAQIASETAANAVRNQYNMSKVEVFVDGIGLGRDAAIRALQNVDIHVSSITDVTGTPHGGVRPKKARRV